MSAARVLIAGGGVGALEAALALRDLAGDRAEVSLYSPREDFVYRPFAVSEPFGTSHGMRYDLGALAERCGASFHRAAIGSVDPEARIAMTHDGDRAEYDYLIVASGTRLLAGVSGSLTFWGVEQDPRVEGLIADLVKGRIGRLVFAMPAGGSWALPLYELALIAQSEISKAGAGAGITIVTPEERPLGVFGLAVAERVAELLASRGIDLLAGATPVRFGEGRLTVSPANEVEADAVISLPSMEGRRIAGVPHDAGGFVRVDDHCRVLGISNAFAVGDVTSFPVKQGGLAAQQADVAAEEIAAELGCETAAREFEPVMRGVLWTGAEPLYLSGELTGGHGEASAASARPGWDGGELDKVVGRYLTRFLAEVPSGAGVVQ